MLTYLWESWVADHLGELVAGAHLDVPGYLPHPRDAGFSPLRFAEPHGQIADYVAPLGGRSRLHVHVYNDGRMRVHRDAYDPGRGVVPAVLHVALETQGGRTIAFGALTAAAGRVIDAAISRRKGRVG